MLDEPSLQFDWEESIEISARVHRALDFVARVLRERGSTGQPIWPVVPSSSSTMLACTGGVPLHGCRQTPRATLWRAASERGTTCWAQASFCR